MRYSVSAAASDSRYITRYAIWRISERRRAATGRMLLIRDALTTSQKGTQVLSITASIHGKYAGDNGVPMSYYAYKIRPTIGQDPPLAYPTLHRKIGRIGEEMRNAVCDLRKKGMTLADIAMKTGLGNSYICRVLFRAGLTKPRLVQKRNMALALDDIRAGTPVPLVANKYGYSNGSVYNAAHAAGLLVGRRRIPPVTVSRIHALYKDGNNTREISDITGVAMSTVYLIGHRVEKTGRH